MAKKIPDLDLSYPWDIDPKRAIDIALKRLNEVNV